MPWAGVALWDSLQFLIQKNRYCSNSVLYCVVYTYDAFWVNLNCVGKTSWDAQLQLAVCQALPSCFMISQKTLMGRRASPRPCGSMRQVELYFGINSITTFLLYCKINDCIYVYILCEYLNSLCFRVLVLGFKRS